MKYWLHLFTMTLLIVLLAGLSACASPASPDRPQPETPEPPPVLSLRIDPETGTVTPAGGSALTAQQVNVIKVGNDDFRLENFDFAFLAGNRVAISADFVNEPLFDSAVAKRESKALLVPITFEQNEKTSEGITSLSLPKITADTLDGEEKLYPDERVDGVEFLVQHGGKAFDYAVDAFSKVEELDDCSSNTKTRYTLAELDKLKGCEVLSGDLFIDAKNESVDLSALDKLRSVTGDVLLLNLKLEEQKALFPTLQVVRGDVDIRGFEGSVQGFNALKRVTGTLSLVQGKSKTRISGFEALEVLGALSISQNAFPSEEIAEAFLAELVVTDGVTVIDNTAFKTLTFLDALTGTDTLSIKNNAALASLEGLEKLDFADELMIEANPALASITALEKLESVALGIISNNAKLDCSLEPRPAFLPVEQSSGNKVDCPTAPTGDIVITEQAQLEGLRGITVINGSLTVPINLDYGPLKALKEIRGSFRLIGSLRNQTLDFFDFEGLDNLETVGEDLVIDLVPGSSIAFTNLKKLKTVGGALRVTGGNVNFATLPTRPIGPERDIIVLERIGSLEVDACWTLTTKECDDFFDEGGGAPINLIAPRRIFIYLAGLENLTLRGTNLVNLSGLERLRSVNKLVIESNPDLGSLALAFTRDDLGLVNLEQVGFSAINNNAKLDCSLGPRLAFLPANESAGNKVNCPTEPTVFGDVLITSPAQLDSLKGIAVINGSLSIQIFQNQEALSTLNALSSLREVKGNLTIGVSPEQTAAAPVNKGLTSLAGLNALERVEGDLLIKRNLDLAKLTGLGKLRTVLGFSDISENSKLDCSVTPPPFLPADFSIGNGVNCATANDPYALETSGPALIVGRGQDSSVEVNVINRVQGFDEAINFSLLSNPYVTARFEPNPAQTKTVMRFRVAPDAPTGEITLVIKGTSATTRVEQATTLDLLIKGSTPVITSVEVLDSASKQVRQGAGIILLVKGDQLQTFTSARLDDGPGGDINVAGQLALDNTGEPKAPTVSQVELRFEIPHGVTGTPRLSLSTDSGTARLDDAITITPITVSASVEGEGNGTPDRPFATIGEAFTVAEVGDTVFLKNGRYTSPNESFPLSVPADVSVTGESQEATVIVGLAVTAEQRVNTLTFKGTVPSQM